MGAVFACKAIVARGRIARSRPRLGFPVHAFAGTLRRSDPVGGVAAENPRPRTTGRLGGIALNVLVAPAALTPALRDVA